MNQVRETGPPAHPAAPKPGTPTRSPPERPPRRAPVALCYLAFAVSGFAGLVYESVWSRYLQTFLGSEAYAQALVLALFMSGMAAGAWLAARYSSRLTRPLLGYVAVEILLGALAIAFHWVFKATTEWTFSSVVPALPADWLVDAWKWGLASLLILPQCILLGATFPLLAAGVIRGRRATSGRALGWLYFTNSAGGAIGVLVNGFFFVPRMGLIGAVLTAAILNGIAAALVWAAGRRMVRQRPSPEATAPAAAVPAGTFSAQGFCLAVAAVTGAASLVYELVWIRMLNLVLGPSSHSFELMLSAFIGGLALGGLWIRHRADRLASPLLALGVIQLAMGALALATLILYRETFDVMHWLLQGLARTESGYDLFIVGSHALALAVMLPATVCAGMTLPLLTRYQLGRGGGERVIGRTYAANTLGAVVGVFATMHLLLPLLGIKGAMLAGAGLDLTLGVWLLSRATAPLRTRLAGGAFAGGAVVLALLAPSVDLHVLNSGVFSGQDPSRTYKDREILFYRHGKTATVGVIRTRMDDEVHHIGFTTNGKANGSLLFGAPPERVSPDEPSFGLLGLLPLAVRPGIQRAACIGVGTGLTADNLLGSPHLRSLDIVELEPATIEAARYFAERTGRIFTDPRVRFHTADAKTYFRSGGRPAYDLVLSQPSNLWMPGVAGLFTHEFYANLRAALADDGLLVQWLQLYAADEAMVYSVLRALGRNFADYRLYLATGGDLLVLAVKEGRVPVVDADAFAWPQLKDAWTRVGVRHPGDLRLRWAGDRAQVEPAVLLSGTRTNTDYRPILEPRSLRAFFQRRQFRTFDHWTDAFGYPLLANLAGRPVSPAAAAAGADAGEAVTESRTFPRSVVAAKAARLAALLTAPPEAAASQAPVPAPQAAARPGQSSLAGMPMQGAANADPSTREPASFDTLLPLGQWNRLLDQSPCPDAVVDIYWERFLPWLIRGTGPNLGREELRALWTSLNARGCAADIRERDPSLHRFVQAALFGDYRIAGALGTTLLADGNPAHRPFVTVATASALLHTGAYDEVLALLGRMQSPVPARLRDAMTLLAAHAAQRKEQSRQANGG